MKRDLMGFGCMTYLRKTELTPPNKVTIEKDNRVKTDKRDARMLAKNLENKDYVSCNVPSRERRENCRYK